MNFFLDGDAEASTCNSQAIEPIKHTQAGINHNLQSSNYKEANINSSTSSNARPPTSPISLTCIPLPQNLFLLIRFATS